MSKNLSPKRKKYRLRDGQPLCFLHIPKTAGTTLSAILESHFDHQRICPAQTLSTLKPLLPQALERYQLFQGHFSYDIRYLLPRNTAYVTIFRDPIERIISAYEFMKTCIITQPAARKIQHKARTLSLKEYVRDPEVNGVINSQTEIVAGNRLRPKFRKQYLLSKLAPTDPRRLEIAKDHLEQFAWIGITERLEDSLSLLNYRFGWPPSDHIQPLMTGGKKLKRETLSQDVIDAIVEQNQLDVDLYQYAITLFEQNYAQMCERLHHDYGINRNALPCHIPQTEGQESRLLQASSNDLGYLLDRHYIACFDHQGQGANPVDRLCFRVDQAIPGCGWHKLEWLTTVHPFRWTGPQTVSTLDFGLNLHADLALEVKIFKITPLEILRSLQVKANGYRLNLIPLECDRVGIIFRGTIPKTIADPSQPFIRLSFHVDHPHPFNILRPAAIDRRSVGVAVNMVQIFPLGTQPVLNWLTEPLESPAWKEAIAFLKDHLQPHQSLLAPHSFRLVFPDHFPHPATESLDISSNYVAPRLMTRSYEWMIWQKGLPDSAILWLLMQNIRLGFYPVFANSVFVIFAKNTIRPQWRYGFIQILPILLQSGINQLRYWLNPRSNQADFNIFLTSLKQKRITYNLGVALKRLFLR